MRYQRLASGVQERQLKRCSVQQTLDLATSTASLACNAHHPRRKLIADLCSLSAVCRTSNRHKRLHTSQRRGMDKCKARGRQKPLQIDANLDCSA